MSTIYDFLTFLQSDDISKIFKEEKIEGPSPKKQKREEKQKIIQNRIDSFKEFKQLVTEVSDLGNYRKK